MNESEIISLGYLHDAYLRYVRIDFLSANRDLTFAATFDPNCGLPNLNGKTIEVKVSDVTLMTCRVCGAMEQRETIDRCELQVSDTTLHLLAEWLSLGLRKPTAGLTLITHSGSVWEMMYESISVQIL